MSSSPITLWQIDREAMETVTDFIFLDSKITVDGDYNHGIKRCLLLGRKAVTSLDSILKNRDITRQKCLCTQRYSFSSNHVWMSEWDHKEGWEPKNWCFWTVVLEKTLESLLACKGIQPVNPKENQAWIFIGRTDAEGPLLWPPDSKSWLIRKDPDAEKVEGMKRRGWQRLRWLDGITTSMVMNLSKALGNGEGQGSLACCNPGRHKESDMTECLNSQLGVTWRNFLNRPLILSHLSICIFITVDFSEI